MVCSFASIFWSCCNVAPTFTLTGFETLEKKDVYLSYREIVLNCIMISTTHIKDRPTALLIIREKEFYKLPLTGHISNFVHIALCQIDKSEKEGDYGHFHEACKAQLHLSLIHI